MNSPIISLRIPPLILDSIRVAVDAARVDDPAAKPIPMSTWITIACLHYAEYEANQRAERQKQVIKGKGKRRKKNF